MKHPLVSVIVPNYCHAKYLDQRIQSILTQTYKNFELIILDDCSPDNGASIAVIEEYRSNPHVSQIIYNKKNSGSTFKQWRKGFELAKGELIWIAESDDYCEPTYLETLVQNIESHNNASFCFCISQFVTEDGTFLHCWPILDKNTSVYFIKSDEFLREYMAKGTAVVNASAVLFKKDIALGIDRYYEEFKAAGDSMFWVEMAEQGDVICVNSPHNYFRQHDTNKVSPLKMRQGITYTERHLIYRYMCDRGWLDLWDKLETIYYYYSKINSTKFDNEEIKKNLLKLWNPLSFLPIFTYKCIGRLLWLNNLITKRNG